MERNDYISKIFKVMRGVQNGIWTNSGGFVYHTRRVGIDYDNVNLKIESFSNPFVAAMFASMGYCDTDTLYINGKMTYGKDWSLNEHDLYFPLPDVHIDDDITKSIKLQSNSIYGSQAFQTMQVAYTINDEDNES